MEKKNKIILGITLGLILLFLLIYGSGGFVSPFYGDINLIDEGQFASWISRMNFGGHLYKDVYAAYGPLYIYPLYIFNLVFEPSVFLIRMVYGVFGVFLAILIAVSIFRKLRIPVLFQILPLFLLTFVPAFGVRQAIGLLTILLVYILFEKNKLSWGIAAGISLACSFLISVDTGIFALLTCSVLIIFEVISSKNLKIVIKNLIAILSGALTVFLLFFAWSYYEGWFVSYVTSTINDLTTYSGINLPIGQKNVNPLRILDNTESLFAIVKFIFSKGVMLYWIYLFYLVIFIFLTIKFIRNKFINSDKLIFMICVFGFLLSTVLLGRNGHITYVTPPIFILFGFILNEINKKFIFSKEVKDKFILVFFVFVILIFSERLVLIYRPNFHLIYKIPFTIFDNKNNPAYVGNILISNNQKRSFQDLKEYVDKNINPNDEIFFFSNEPMMYLVVGRRNTNKYDLPEVASLKEKRLEILNSLIAKKPKYVIEDKNAWSVDGISNRRRLPEVYEYILKNYTKEDYGQFIIYKLKKIN